MYEMGLIVVRRFLLFLFLFVGVISAGSLRAANELPDSCDSEFYDLMKDVSWQHGQRETEMAQRMILKPDSVMEYTCFYQEVSKVPGAHAIAKPPMIRFLEGSFAADLAGGTYDASKDSYPKAAPTTCYTMDLIWHALKCRNFGVDGDIDDFFLKFDQLQNYDPRQFPLACEDPSDARKNKWEAANDRTGYDNVLAQ